MWKNLPKKPSKPSNKLPRGFQNPPKLISNKNRTPDTILDFKITPKSLKMSPEGNLSKNHLLKLSQPLPASLSLSQPSQPASASLSLSQPLSASRSLSQPLSASLSLSLPLSALLSLSQLLSASLSLSQPLSAALSLSKAPPLPNPKNCKSASKLIL